MWHDPKEFDNDRPLLRRLLGAVWLALACPQQAASGRLHAYFNSRGAIPTVVALFLVVMTALFFTSPAYMFQDWPRGPALLGAGMLATICLFAVALTVAVVVAGDCLFGDWDYFRAEFVLLALTFGLAEAAVTAVFLPLEIGLVASGTDYPAAAVDTLRRAWKFALFLYFTADMTHLDLKPALAFLLLAQALAMIMISLALAGLGALLGG